MLPYEQSRREDGGRQYADNTQRRQVRPRARQQERKSALYSNLPPDYHCSRTAQPIINKPMTAGDASLPSVIATKLPWMAEKEALVKVLQELAFTKVRRCPYLPLLARFSKLTYCLKDRQALCRGR